MCKRNIYKVFGFFVRSLVYWFLCSVLCGYWNCVTATVQFERARSLTLFLYPVCARKWPKQRRPKVQTNARKEENTQKILFMRIVFRYCFLWWKDNTHTHCRRQATPHAIYTHTFPHAHTERELETNKYLKRHNKMAAASLRNVEIAAAAATAAVAEVADDGGDDKNNSSRHTSCSGYSNQHTYHQQELEQPKKRNIYHQTANCHYHHAGASILFWLAVILVLGELKTGEFIFAFLLFSILCAALWRRHSRRCGAAYLYASCPTRMLQDDILMYVCVSVHA